MKIPFTFEAPTWANQPTVNNKDDALQRARDLAACVYPLGVQSGVHAMIEWCGVMGEYVKMLEVVAKTGVDVRDVDQHHRIEVNVPDFMVDYFCEKLGCQIKPFIRANREAWRKAIDRWFE